MGRKTKLTAERQKLITDALRGGNTRTASVGYGNIDYKTFLNWLRRGEDEEEGIYVQFLQAVKKAEADAEVRNVALIQRAANDGTWQAAAWWLERRRPDRWALRQGDTTFQDDIIVDLVPDDDD